LAGFILFVSIIGSLMLTLTLNKAVDMRSWHYSSYFFDDTFFNWSIKYHSYWA